MENHTIRLDEIARHDRAINSHSAVQGRKNPLSNIWIFDSHKAGLRFSISSDLHFRAFVLLEGDTQVSSYHPYPSFESNSLNSRGALLPTVLIEKKDGSKEFREYVRTKTPAKQASVNQHNKNLPPAGAIAYVLEPESQMEGKEILFDNWLLLTSAITRARSLGKFMEGRILSELMDCERAVTLGDLSIKDGVDPALMLASVALLLQKGTLHANLEHSIFTTNTELRYVRANKFSE